MFYCIGDDRTGSNDDVDIAGDHVGHQFTQPLDTTVGVTVLDDDVATFVVTQLAQALLKAGPCRGIAALGAYPEIADMRDLGRYLRTGGQRST
jgi:hypothetical protein